MPDQTITAWPLVEPDPAPAPPATDEVTPYDLHGPGRCGHDGCRREEGRG